MSIKTCMYCGSDKLVTGINIKMSAEVNRIGLSHRSKLLSMLRCVEPVYADLCKECGSITRLWVKDTEQYWDTE